VDILEESMGMGMGMGMGMDRLPEALLPLKDRLLRHDVRFHLFV
jgi:hypothetical protein